MYYALTGRVTATFQIKPYKCWYHYLHYLCTLTQSCISQYDPITTNQDALLLSVVSTKEEFSLTPECKEYIPSLIIIDLEKSKPVKESQPDQMESAKWTKCGSIQLCKKDKIAVVKRSAHQCSPVIAKTHLNGLQSTLYQLKEPLENHTNVIQIIHVNGLC